MSNQIFNEFRYSKNDINKISSALNKILENPNNILENSENKFSENLGHNSISRVDFYQEENVRLGSELLETKKKFEIMKTEIEKFQNQRSSLIEKINSVNEAIKDSNIVTNVFENKNSQDKIYIKDPQKNIKKNSLNLNSEIEKIFQKK